MLSSGAKFGDLGEVENPEQNLVKSSFGLLAKLVSRKRQFTNETKMGIWKSGSGLVIGKQGVVHESYISHIEDGGSLQKAI